MKHGPKRFSKRVWELRHNVAIYDGRYVALAEALDLPLATPDGRLARADGPTCRFLTPHSNRWTSHGSTSMPVCRLLAVSVPSPVGGLGRFGAQKHQGIRSSRQARDTLFRAV